MIHMRTVDDKHELFLDTDTDMAHVIKVENADFPTPADAVLTIDSSGYIFDMKDGKPNTRISKITQRDEVVQMMKEYGPRNFPFMDLVMKCRASNFDAYFIVEASFAKLWLMYMEKRKTCGHRWRDGRDEGWDGEICSHCDEHRYWPEVKADPVDEPEGLFLPKEMFCNDPRNPLKSPLIHDGYVAGFNRALKEVVELNAHLFPGATNEDIALSRSKRLEQGLEKAIPAEEVFKRLGL